MTTEAITTPAWFDLSAFVDQDFVEKAAAIATELEEMTAKLAPVVQRAANLIKAEDEGSTMLLAALPADAQDGVAHLVRECSGVTRVHEAVLRIESLLADTGLL